MSTAFTQVTDGVSSVQASQLNQYAGPVNDIEDGANCYVTEDGASVADVYVVVPDPPAPDPLTAGYHVRMKVTNANTGAATIDVGVAAGAKAIKKRGGTALASGDLPAGLVAELVYDGTNFELQNPAAAAGGASALDDLSDVTITAAASGDLLRHNGTAWVDATPADAGLLTTSATLDDLSGVDVTGAATGAILTKGASTWDDLPAGTNGHVLTMVSGAPAWAAATGGAADFTDLGDVPGAYTGHANKVVAVKGDETGLEFVAPTTPTLPTTTKGDLIVDDGTDVQRLPVGTNGQVLTANSAEALGVEWTTPSAGSGYSERLVLPFWEHAGSKLWTESAGTWQVGGLDAGHALGHGFDNGGGTPAVGDAVQRSFSVPSTGTYACRIFGSTSTGAGIVTVKLDGSSKSPTWDTYSDPNQYNRWSDEVSLGSLTANTNYTIRLEVTSKNASSSGYLLVAYEVHIYRTA